ncbi:hypothetical protein CN934_15345 [Ensifer sp. MMN_5]|jgi:hypothetical protein|nr:hypothetical protein CN934_15345 [Ensifer sp. MMN_5]PND28046.1 hypothetical protein CN933_08085 [Sinorhizobium sp. M4_45]
MVETRDAGGNCTHFSSASHKTRGAVGNVSEDCNVSSFLIPCARHRDPAAARKEFVQPKDLVWLDSCDKHRNEEMKQAAAGGPNLNRP